MQNSEYRLALGGFCWIVLGILLSPSFPHIQNIGLLLISFFSARMAGMSCNKLIDRTFDKENPRTKKRALPSGRAKPQEVFMHSLLSLILFLFCTSFLPRVFWPIALFVVFHLIFYSYTKRWTYLCHFILSIIHFFLPLCGALLAVQSYELIPISVWYMSCAAFFCVAASDILYALQDEGIDRRLGLYSIPVRFGRKKAVRIAATSYIIALLLSFLALYSFLPLLSFSLLLFLGFSWRYFLQNGYTISEKQLPTMLSILPSINLSLVVFTWLNTTLLEFLGHLE